MLQAVSNVAPRGVYVCGNTTTSSGLTVTLTKESGSGDFALEAGALVLGDRGKAIFLLNLFNIAASLNLISQFWQSRGYSDFRKQ